MEGARSSVGDCWKGLGMRSTLKCLRNSEVVRVRRMPKVFEVRVGKTLRCFRSGKRVIPGQTCDVYTSHVVKASEASTVEILSREVEKAF